MSGINNKTNCLPGDRGNAPVSGPGWGFQLQPGVTWHASPSPNLLQHQLLDAAPRHKGLTTKTQVFLLLQTIKQLALDKQNLA